MSVWKPFQVQKEHVQKKKEKNPFHITSIILNAHKIQKNHNEDVAESV